MSRFPALLILFVLVLVSAPAPSAGEEEGLPNPYFDTTEWRVWRDDPEPISGVPAVVPPQKQPPAVIGPAPEAKRLWPVDSPEGHVVAYGPEPSARYAGIWDDVYASWSGTHGYVRNEWQGSDGSRVAGVKDAIIHLVDGDKERNILRVGINFYHQSTTGMGHSIANGVLPGRTEGFEKIYFADGLITGPAHSSYTESGAGEADRTRDLYLALAPFYFNSVGSSNSETMAITKMILAGGYLSPDVKLTLKQNGLYPSAMLWLWKEAFPFDAPFGSEWKQRIAYKAVGDRFAYPGKYGAAGIARGDMCLPFHQYDDTEHMRRMVELAKGLESPPPEVVLDVVERAGGKLGYALKKSVLVVTEKGQDVSLTVSAKKSFDVAGRPLEFRWRLLYGAPGTRVTRVGAEPVWRIEVPWDEDLPEGRTTLVLVANNGRTDGNPAAVNVFRKRGALPGAGLAPQSYGYPGKEANRRPVLVGLQDVAVRPGETVRISLRAVDPEGWPLRYAKRAGEPGAFDGNLYVWECPRDAKPGDRVVTIVGSDGTSGNSYEGRRLRLRVSPKVHATIAADRWVGTAPMKVAFTAEGTVGAKKLSWAFEPRQPGVPKMPKATAEGPTATHEFAKPGIYTVWLKAEGAGGSHEARVSVLVTAGEQEVRPPELFVTGNGVSIADRTDPPNEFDGTHFGAVAEGGAVEREFLLANRGDGEIELGGDGATIVEQGRPGEFEIVKPPRGSIGPGGSTTVRIRFRPLGPGRRSATVVIRGPGGEGGVRFAIAGESLISQEKVDAEAAPDFRKAEALVGSERWEKAIEALRAFVREWPAATQAAEARRLLEKLENDPAVKEAIAARRAAEEAERQQAARDEEAKRLFNLARNYAANGLGDKAKELYEKVVEDFPNSPWAEKARAALK